VHLGIDTVTLGGEGFTVLAAEGDQVEAGTPVVAWDPAAVEASGRSPVCPVIALDAVPAAVEVLAGGHIATGRPLFRWT
jgi:PTS system glucose-specific IIA component